MGRITPRFLSPSAAFVNPYQPTSTFSYDSDVETYRDRVEADGGEVIDIGYLDTAVLAAKDADVWNDIAFWVDPNFGIKRSGTDMTDLYDLKSNDATSPTSLEPQYASNQANGKALMGFSGGQRFDGATFSTALSQPNTIFVVGNVTTADGALVHSTDAAARHTVEVDSSSDLVAFAGGAATIKGVGTYTGSLMLVTFLANNGGTSTLRFNGTHVASGTLGTETFAGVRLGDNAGLTRPLTGQEGSVIVVNGAISTTKRDALETLLTNAYGL